MPEIALRHFCWLLAAGLMFAVRPVQASEVPMSNGPVHVPTSGSVDELERANPVRPLTAVPLGNDQELDKVPNRPDPQRARLGRWLFFDPRLSIGSVKSCAKCHHPDKAFGADVVLTMDLFGLKLKRKTMSFINTAFAVYPEQFWDGRAENLVEQPKGATLNVDAIAAIAGYRPFFAKAFGDTKVTTDRVCVALADYERTRVSGNARWDRWRRLGDEKAVSEQVMLGDWVFFEKGRCVMCHAASVATDPKFTGSRDAKARGKTEGALHIVANSFTDWRFHNEGIGYDAQKKEWSDRGRAYVTHRKEDIGAFRTPPLRDVALHPPYMHDGSLPTLAAVVEHYRKGGIDNPYLDPLMEPLPLTDAECKALVAFLEALTGEGYADTPPALFPK